MRMFEAVDVSAFNPSARRPGYKALLTAIAA
jgi:hypothetical protein